jgi:N utilization substance protein B
MLFQLEASACDASIVIQSFWHNFEAAPEGKDYADEIVRGVAERLEAIDAEIGRASEHWRIERMSRVDRNILRLGTYEILTQRAVPGPVILDEAVELAKSFGSEGSSVFVNGVLNKIADTHNRREAKG